MGEITAPGVLTVALQGVDTVVHMAYEVKPGGTLADMHEANVVGTRTLLDAAEAAGITRVVAGRFVPTVDLGVGCVDVRDFADGVLLAAERGRPGQRYVLCAHTLP